MVHFIYLAKLYIHVGTRSDKTVSFFSLKYILEKYANFVFYTFHTIIICSSHIKLNYYIIAT